NSPRGDVLRTEPDHEDLAKRTARVARITPLALQRGRRATRYDNHRGDDRNCAGETQLYDLHPRALKLHCAAPSVCQRDRATVKIERPAPRAQDIVVRTILTAHAPTTRTGSARIHPAKSYVKRISAGGGEWWLSVTRSCHDDPFDAPR